MYGKRMLAVIILHRFRLWCLLLLNALQLRPRGLIVLAAVGHFTGKLSAELEVFRGGHALWLLVGVVERSSSIGHLCRGGRRVGRVSRHVHCLRSVHGMLHTSSAMGGLTLPSGRIRASDATGGMNGKALLRKVLAGGQLASHDATSQSSDAPPPEQKS